jgi:hypothetical protein
MLEKTWVKSPGTGRLEHSNRVYKSGNSKAERARRTKFCYLMGRLRSMLNRSGVTKELREKFWAECASTATKLNNIMRRKDWKSAFEKYHGYESKITYNLKVFEEDGIKLSKLYGLPEKLSNKGNLCIMLGYPKIIPQTHTEF